MALIPPISFEKNSYIYLIIKPESLFFLEILIKLHIICVVYRIHIPQYYNLYIKSSGY